MGSCSRPATATCTTRTGRVLRSFVRVVAWGSSPYHNGMGGTRSDLEPARLSVSRTSKVGPEFDYEMVILLLRSTFSIVSGGGFKLYSLERVLMAVVGVAGGRKRLLFLICTLKREYRPRSWTRLMIIVHITMFAMFPWRQGCKVHFFHLNLRPFVAFGCMLDQLDGFPTGAINCCGQRYGESLNLFLGLAILLVQIEAGIIRPWE